MELISAYLYNRAPVNTRDIASISMIQLTRNGWYKDARASKKFQVLNKRFKIQDQWYRVIVRFEQQEDGSFVLNTPLPFVVVETSTQDGVLFRDTMIYHGRDVKSTIGYLQRGVPSALIDAVIQDLKMYIRYTDSDEKIAEPIHIEF